MKKSYNLRYVDIIEEQLNEALTTYRKPVNGDNYVRRSSQRKPKPHVYLPVHLYGQLVHSKSGCQLLEAQNVVYDLSCQVRSPNLDQWDGIKQLKAALWALGNIGSTNWGLNLLLEESVIPDIVSLAYHCEVLSIRGTCVYVLGLMSKTKPGCEALKQEGWDSVRHSRSTLWPVDPEEFEAHLKPCSLNFTESTSSQHNSDRESVNPDITLNVEKLDTGEFPEKIFRKLMEPTSDSTQSSSRLRSRFIHSLSLPLRKPRSAPYPKYTATGKTLEAKEHSTEDLSTSSSGSIHSFPIYRNGKLSNESSTEEMEIAKENTTRNEEEHFNRSAKLRKDALDIDGLKIRSHSLNIDSARSSSSSLSESRENLTSSTDCLCLTINNQAASHTQHLTPAPSFPPLTNAKSGSTSLVTPGSSHTLPRRAHSLRSPTVPPLSSSSLRSFNAHYPYTSPRDALGYATLRRLQHQRIQPTLSHNETLVSPAKGMLFTDAITMNTSSLDSRLTSKRFLKALSFTSLDKENLLSPINQSTIQRSSSVRSLVSTGSSEDYIGLALPVDINCMFQVKESPYFQKMSSLPSEDFSAILLSGEIGSADGCQPMRPYFTERVAVSLTDPLKMLGLEDTGLQEHNDSNCLYCAALCMLGCNSHTINSDLSEEASTGESNISPAVTTPNLTEATDCSDVVSYESADSGQSTDVVLGGKSLTEEDTQANRVLLRKEVLRLIINLSSSVGTKSHETNLLTIKEKFPYVFDDICLYSEVSFLLAHCTFRLLSRRFVQELFQDVPFVPMYAVAESILSMPQHKTSSQNSDC